MTTAATTLYENGVLEQRAVQAKKLLAHCTLCPKKCKVNRLNGETGFCNTGEYSGVASYGPHFGEEQPLVGSHGSGTIFFTGCNLGCLFCQNFDISHAPAGGMEVTAEQLAAIMLELQEQGCHNINFVTPSHVVPQIMDALVHALPLGLNLPLVYNSSGYDSMKSLSLLEGVIDIYMPDFKFWESSTASAWAQAADYPEVAKQALREMHRQVGELQLDKQIAVKGVLVRHLLMPQMLDQTEKILSFIASSISKNTYINIMDQYRPCGQADTIPQLNQPLGSDDYQQALAMAKKLQLKRIDPRDFGDLLLRMLKGK